MSTTTSRRDFLKNSSLLIGGTAVFGSAAFLSGCSSAEATSSPAEPAEIVIPAHPYQYVELDTVKAEDIAYNGYYEAGCCYGVAKAMLGQLQDQVGFPYTAIPVDMYKTGKEGYAIGTLCGALAGAVNVISVCAPTDAAKDIIADLFKWYSSTNLPLYRPEGLSDVQTVSGSVNCAESVTIFKNAAGVEQDDPIRKERCGAISADVAKKSIELLNIYYGYAEAPAPEPEAEVVLADNEYIGEADGYGGNVKVKVTMDKDQISKIEVLEHSETAGISDPAFAAIPDAIIAAQSTKIDHVAGATVSSNAIMAAVENALSKVAK